ncbi:MAG: pilus assembly protein PilM [Patescibacteria group bacterium]
MFSIFTKKIFGLDISDYSIEAMELEQNFGKKNIKSYSRVKMESGIVENGKILNLSKLASNVDEVLATAKPKAIKTKDVSISLPDSQVYTATINLPLDLKDSEITEAIANQIPEIMPFDYNSTVNAWQVLEKNDEEQTIFVAAVDREIYNGYEELAKKLNIRISSMEIESIATARAVIDKINSNEGVLLLDIGARTSNISVFYGLGLYSTHNVPVAGHTFTQAISEKLKISFTEAEKLKITNGLDYKKNQGELLLIIQSHLQEILPEIKKSMSYFEDKTKKQINFGCLVGGSAFLNGLPEYLTANLKIKLEIGNPFTKIGNYAIIKKQGLLFANVLGLALRHIDDNSWQNNINFIK